MAVVTTVIIVSNLHCISCCRSISDILLNLRAAPSNISTCIAGQQVTVTHGLDVTPEEIVRALLDAGFEIDSITAGDNPTNLRASTLSAYLAACTDRTAELEDARRYRDNYMFHGTGSDRRHLNHCDMCRMQAGKGDRTSVLSLTAGRSRPDSIDRSSRRQSRMSWLYDGSMWFTPPPPLPGGPEAISHNLSSRFRPASRKYGSTENFGTGGTVPNFSRPGSRMPSRPGSRAPSRPVSHRFLTSMPDFESKAVMDDPLIIPPKSIANSAVHSISTDSAPSSPEFTEKPRPKSSQKLPESSGAEEYQVTISIGGMTCAVCTGKVTETLEAVEWVREVNISLMTHSGVMIFDAKKSGGKNEGVDVLIDEIECLGYEASLYEIKRLPSPVLEKGPRVFEAVISIGGMTCAVCTGKVAEVVGAITWVKDVNISLMTHSGTVKFDADAAGGEKAGVDTLVDEIECLGYDASLDTLKDLTPKEGAPEVKERRNIALKITGLRGTSDIDRIVDTLDKAYQSPMLDIETAPTMRVPILYISYTPKVPEFTIRHIVATLKDIDPEYDATVYHPPSIEERAHEIQRRERNDLLRRLIVCFICVVPTFLIGIVWMSLVSPQNPQRVFFEKNMWAGAVSRTEWALLFLSTPVMFYCAEPFHRRAFREIVAMWRKGSHVPLLRRFYRFGSMNLLISLGVTISYVSSIVMLGLGTARHPVHHMKMETTTYFDSTVFLTFFLLMGRYLEAYSKAKTADAVSLITKLRPTEAVLVTPVDDPTRPERALVSPVEDLDAINSVYNDSRQQRTRRIPADLIEVGDTVCIPHGTSPPADATVITGESSFDESSLTGEALLVPKSIGDQVYAGTINHGQVINAIVDKASGESMIDQIVNVVREGQNRHAPIERIADQVTAYFVPTICLLAVLTWVIWLTLGVSGSLPANYLDTPQGGWYFWSLSFAIAVFVVACPCGIGLAAPCAMHVGASLAARNAILAKGGGEAFQEASRLDVVVFDKTGTLTMGVEPVVSHEKLTVVDPWNAALINFIARALEENSVHPLARALVVHTDSKQCASGEALETEEIPGKGSKGRFKVGGIEYEAIVGNERFMNEHAVLGLQGYSTLLESWKMEGNSIILLAIRAPNGGDKEVSGGAFGQDFKLAAMYGTTDPIRPEARAVVQALQKDGIDVWMITGDNPITAAAVGVKVGIGADNIIAGVLPTEKADKVIHLQSLAPSRPRSTRFNIFPRSTPRSPTQRSLVAMVGDGINDAPALAQADVGVSIGSGSDVAMQTSKFILVSSDLRSLYTLTQLSKAVIRRVKFNFLWACVFNVCAIPLAAGVLYPTEKRIRLSPVWAALTMALSSVSVVCCSLLLKTEMWGVGFRPKKVRVR